MSRITRQYNQAFVEQKIASLGLPKYVARKMIEWIQDVVARQSGYADGTAVNQLCFGGQTGDWYIAHMSVSFTFQDGVCIVRDCWCQAICPNDLPDGAKGR
ncbi:MAG TPA: hypothetical protein VF306_09495 [Pirellulales bacterium]